MPALRAVRPTVMLHLCRCSSKRSIVGKSGIDSIPTGSGARCIASVSFGVICIVSRYETDEIVRSADAFLGIGGAKLDRGAEQFLLEAKVPVASDTV